MKKLRMGIIGFGFMGHEHYTMLKTLSDIEVIAVCDVDAEQMKDVCDEVKTFTVADALLACEEIDTVLIATPNPSHIEMVQKAAKAGKHIICEKPAAMSVHEFDDMVSITKAAGVTFTVHHQRRLDKDFCTIKQIYDTKALGDIYVIKSELYGVNGNMHDWHIYPEMGGGMLYDWGVHLIDQILYLVDSDVDSIYANVQNVINEKVDDYFHIVTRFKNGVTAHIELGTYYLTPRRSWFMGGNGGSAVIDEGFLLEGRIVRTTKLLENAGTGRTMTAAGPTRSFGPPEAGILYEETLPEVKAEHRDFFVNYLDARDGNAEFLVKPEQVRRVLRFMDAVRQSALSGEAVLFER